MYVQLLLMLEQEKIRRVFLFWCSTMSHRSTSAFRRSGALSNGLGITSCPRIYYTDTVHVGCRRDSRTGLAWMITAALSVVQEGQLLINVAPKTRHLKPHRCCSAWLSLLMGLLAVHACECMCCHLAGRKSSAMPEHEMNF